jgi:hypothetical protein
MGVFSNLVLALPNLRFAYPLDAAGTADVGPNGLTLTATGSPGTESPGPVLDDDATTFNGSSQSMSRAHDTAFNFGTNDFTIGAFIKPSSVAAGSRFFVDHDGDGGPGAWEAFQSAATLSSRLDGTLAVTTGSILDTTNWHFVAIVMDRDAVGRWWRNADWAMTGVDITSLSATTIDVTGTMWIGRRESTGYFSGSIAWVFGCAAALTNTQLLALYDARDDVLPVQTIVPDADTTTTGWTATPLWSKIEETSADGTVITATAA